MAKRVLPTATPTVTRSVDLEPEDYLWVTYLLRKPLPWTPPKTKAADLDKCFKLMINRLPDTVGLYAWSNVEPHIDGPLPPEEAHFWLAARSMWKDQMLKSVLLRRLKKAAFRPQVPAAEVRQLLVEATDPWCGTKLMTLAARSILDPAGYVELFADPSALPASLGALDDPRNLNDAFRLLALPYLSESQVAQVREACRPHVTAGKWATLGRNSPNVAFYVGALCGLHAELESVVGSLIPPGYQHNRADLIRLVFGLASRKAVLEHLRRLQLKLNQPEMIRGWLAHTAWEGVETLGETIRQEGNKQSAERAAKELRRVQAPEAAPTVLELSLDSKAPGLAREWLAANPANAVAGLLPVAAGKGKYAQAALEFLRDLKRKGQSAVIEEQLKGATPELAAFVRLSVLERQEKTYPALADADMPEPLRKTIAALPVKKSALPGWVDVGTLPPILVNGAKLSEAHTSLMLDTLRAAKPEVKPAIAIALKKYADPAALDAFAWHLFELWVREGMPSKERWAFLALGLFGGDASALKLTPFIREWPGMSKHPQAVLGLQMLREIGTDTALMQLNGIAQKVKFQGVKAKAREMMESIAADRKMTRADLEDRIVPDLDLDDQGGRTFDFGPRQFRMAIGPDLSPVIRDADGKTRADLPAPAAKDDAEKAAAAVAEWKLLKKQLKELLKIQGPRLEQAMVTMRRWSVGDFESLLVRHPLMTNLARRLVWGAYDGAGQLANTFRVTEEREYAGADDRPVSLVKAATVGVVHPLHLDGTAKAAWGQLLGEYEVIPPFPQLGRAVYRLEKGEVKAREITRLSEVSIPTLAVWGAMEKLGWVRGSSSDHGVVREFVKWFPAADVTAVLQIDPGIARGLLDAISDDQTVTGCCFLGGRYDPVAYPYHKDSQKKVLGEVDPVAVSEVLADLTALAAKGT